MTVLHSGTTKKYANNWANAFGKKGSAKAEKGGAKAPPAKKKAAKKKS